MTQTTNFGLNLFEGSDRVSLNRINENTQALDEALASVFEVGAEAPGNTKRLWIDTAAGGVAKYHNGTEWVAVASVWS